EPSAAPHLARHLLHDAEVAELPPRRTLGILATLATRDPLLDGHSHVAGQLLVQLQVSAMPTPGRDHASVSGTGGARIPAMPSDSCSQRERSAASCFRPAAVSR